MANLSIDEGSCPVPSDSEFGPSKENVRTIKELGIGSAIRNTPIK